MVTRNNKNRAELGWRATRLLEAFFRDHPGLQRIALDSAFNGHAKDPRGLLQSDAPPAEFAVDCVTVLMSYGCTDGRQHSLGRLLAVIREQFLGANPPTDFVELPPLLNQPCRLPNREEERAYLQRLLADIEHKAALYAPLRGIARITAKADPLLEAWEDLAMLRHVRRNGSTRQQQEPRDYANILNAFPRIRRAALLGRPGAGKSTTLRRLAADLAERALSDPQPPLPDSPRRQSLHAHHALHGLGRSGRRIAAQPG